MATKMFPSNNPMDAGARIKACDLLNALLADTTDLTSQVKHAHWNVKSATFYMHHKLFDELYEPLPDVTDTIAERIAALGGMALGTIRMACAASRLPELMSMTVDGTALIRELVERYALLSKNLSAAIAALDSLGDVTSANLLQDMQHTIDKGLYFLESHVIG